MIPLASSDAARRQVRGKRLRQLDQDGGHQVGQDERVVRSGGSGRQGALACLEPVGKAVALRVLARSPSTASGSVSIPTARAGAEAERGQRQDPGAAADVEDAVRHRLHGLEQLAGSRGWSDAGPVPKAMPGSSVMADLAGRERPPSAQDGTITTRPMRCAT